MSTTTNEEGLVGVCVILFIITAIAICLMVFKTFCGLPNGEGLPNVIAMRSLGQRNLPDPNRSNIGPQPAVLSKVSYIT